MTTKVAVTKTVDLEASKLTAVKATVESISARLSALSTSVRRVQTNINNDIDFEGYLTFNEKAWDTSMEASLEEHAELTAYASEAFQLLNATVSAQTSNNDVLITLQERAVELKNALESTLETLNAMDSGEDGTGSETACENINSCACPKRDKGELLVFSTQRTYSPTYQTIFLHRLHHPLLLLHRPIHLTCRRDVRRNMLWPTAAVQAPKTRK